MHARFLDGANVAGRCKTSLCSRISEFCIRVFCAVLRSLLPGKGLGSALAREILTSVPKLVCFARALQRNARRFMVLRVARASKREVFCLDCCAVLAHSNYDSRRERPLTLSSSARSGSASAGARGRRIGCGQWCEVELSKSVRLGFSAVDELNRLLYICTYIGFGHLYDFGMLLASAWYCSELRREALEHGCGG